MSATATQSRSRYPDRRQSPDEERWRPDVDLGRDAPGQKVVAAISETDFARRAADRESNRQLDQMIQSTPGYRQSSRDAGSAFPRDATAELAHPAMTRRLPFHDEIRQPLSGRQRAVRSKTKNQVQDRLSAAQHREMSRLLESERAWGDLNDELSLHAGNLQELSPASRRRVRRVDRTIQSYEITGDGREHIVYARAQLPDYVPAAKALDYVRENFAVGEQMTFDRYTLGTHQLHEHDPFIDQGHTIVIFEIKTKRGMYLGGSSTSDQTAQLLPRGFDTRVVGAGHRARYRRRDGSEGHVIVVQISDDPTQEPTT